MTAALVTGGCAGEDESGGFETDEASPATTTGDAQTTVEANTITVAVPATEEGMMNGTNWWAHEVSRRTGGRVNFDIHYADSLVPALEVLPAIRDGRIDAGWLSDPYWPTELPLWQVVGIPFETSDPYAGAMAFAELYETHDAFRDEFDRAGVRPLHFLPYFPTMLGSREPVEGLAPLSGRRFRAVGYIADALAAIGAEPTAMAAGEMYEAIQRGVIDGYAGFPMDTVSEFGLQEVAPHTVELGVGHYASTAIGIGLETWESLPQDVRDAMTAASSELQRERGIQELQKLVDQVCDRYADAGAELSALDAEDVEEWKERVGTSLFEKWLADAEDRGVPRDVALDFYEAYHAAYERHLADSDWEDPVAHCAERNR